MFSFTLIAAIVYWMGCFWLACEFAPMVINRRRKKDKIKIFLESVFVALTWPVCFTFVGLQYAADVIKAWMKS